MLLNALAALPDVHALIVGTALFEDEAYPLLLERRAAALGLAERVHFLGYRDDVPALMREVDVVVHASTAPEPFGRVVVEAMLASTPVVATCVGGVPEIIEHGVTGLLVSPGDPSALEEAVRALMADRLWAGQVGRRGEEAALRRFGLQPMLRRLDEQLAVARLHME